jgi:transposase
MKTRLVPMGPRSQARFIAHQVAAQTKNRESGVAVAARAGITESALRRAKKAIAAGRQPFKRGAPSALSDVEENEIVQWICKRKRTDAAFFEEIISKVGCSIFYYIWPSTLNINHCRSIGSRDL